MKNIVTIKQALDMITATLNPINSHHPSMRCSWEVTWYYIYYIIMLYILYIRLQGSHGYQTGQDADLQLEAPILKVI